MVLFVCGVKFTCWLLNSTTAYAKSTYSPSKSTTRALNSTRPIKIKHSLANASAIAFRCKRNAGHSFFGIDLECEIYHLPVEINFPSLFFINR